MPSILRMGLFTALVSACLLLSGGVAANDIIVLPPPSSPPKASSVYGLILVQGAQIPNDRYTPLASAIQAASQGSMWVGLPSYILDTPEPLQLASGITSTLAAMRKQGLPSTAPVFIAGHSLGGAMIQDWVASNPTQVAGQVLLASFLVRKYRETAYGKPYPVPTLTVGGELDGLCRVTRIAEAFYFAVQNPQTGMTPADFPVVVLDGVSHMQFASGAPPLLVKQRDLEPEVTLDAAHSAIAAVVSAWLDSRVSLASTSAIDAAVQATAAFVAPLIESMQLEASYHLKKPCYYDAPTPACQLGNPWSEKVSQITMAGLPNVQFTIVDAFHPVSQINPIHLPAFFNNCTLADTTAGKCQLTISTVTENLYEELDSLDTGFSYVSAIEMRTKMKSRQTVWEAAGHADATTQFHQLDEVPMTCRDINQVALDWAASNTGAKTAARFARIGEKLVLGDDLGPYNAGPLWIWNNMKYTGGLKDASGAPYTLVQAPMMHTPDNYPVALARGFHYCKVLSPARTIEWMYVDGLRALGSLKSAAVRETVAYI